jgi:hypothetical protein
MYRNQFVVTVSIDTCLRYGTIMKVKRNTSIPLSVQPAILSCSQEEMLSGIPLGPAANSVSKRPDKKLLMSDAHFGFGRNESS